MPDDIEKIDTSPEEVNKLIDEVEEEDKKAKEESDEPKKEDGKKSKKEDDESSEKEEAKEESGEETKEEAGEKETKDADENESKEDYDRIELNELKAQIEDEESRLEDEKNRSLEKTKALKQNITDLTEANFDLKKSLATSLTATLLKLGWTEEAILDEVSGQSDGSTAKSVLNKLNAEKEVQDLKREKKELTADKAEAKEAQEAETKKEQATYSRRVTLAIQENYKVSSRVAKSVTQLVIETAKDSQDAEEVSRIIKKELGEADKVAKPKDKKEEGKEEETKDKKDKKETKDKKDKKEDKVEKGSSVDLEMKSIKAKLKGMSKEDTRFPKLSEQLQDLEDLVSLL